ncbi:MULTISPECIES: hypothetical protein [unclassified Archaeoglobus]|uniref:hypothetical protein n=1 Tax=unclassified Archaeoglobus TaxID=2643606 RepID=UPI0025BD2050|nr:MULTISPECIES: hypothetical protein [unclassified Archaeoglobus]
MGNLRYKLEVRDPNGEIVDVIKKDNDLFTKNWAMWLAAILKLGFTRDASAGTSYMVLDENGTARYLGGYSGGTDLINRAAPIHLDWGNLWKVAIGSSTSPPSIDDYKLGAEITRVAANAPQLIVDDSTGEIKIVFTATFSFETEQVCSEIGVIISFKDTGNNTYYMLIARDTFTPVTVQAGGSITIQYEMVFNPAQ